MTEAELATALDELLVAFLAAAEERTRLQRQIDDALPLVPFLESLGLDDLDLTRDPDYGREAAL